MSDEDDPESAESFERDAMKEISQPPDSLSLWEEALWDIRAGRVCLYPGHQDHRVVSPRSNALQRQVLGAVLPFDDCQSNCPPAPNGLGRRCR